jgi:hypothetical protein
MDDNLKALLAKAWKNEAVDLEPGRHFFDELLTVRISGTVERQVDQLVAPTVSIPLILTLALFWEKCGLAQDHALQMFKEAITEAMTNGKGKDEQIEAHMMDVERAVAAVKKDLIAKLPKAKRSGRVITKDLEVEVLPVVDEALIEATQGRCGIARRLVRTSVTRVSQ